MFVAIVRFILGFIAAVFVAGLVQVLFVAGLDGIRSGFVESFGLLALLAATQSAVFAFPFAVLAVVVAAGLGVRGLWFYAGCGLLIGLGGFFAQHVGESGPLTIFNRYALAAYAVSGLAAGLVYWLAGVAKAVPRGPTPERSQPEPGPQ